MGCVFSCCFLRMFEAVVLNIALPILQFVLFVYCVADTIFYLFLFLMKTYMAVVGVRLVIKGLPIWHIKTNRKTFIIFVRNGE